MFDMIGANNFSGKVPGYVYRELPPALQQKIEIDPNNPA